jgi:hypothetical protein
MHQQRSFLFCLGLAVVFSCGAVLVQAQGDDVAQAGLFVRPGQQNGNASASFPTVRTTGIRATARVAPVGTDPLANPFKVWTDGEISLYLSCVDITSQGSEPSFEVSLYWKAVARNPQNIYAAYCEGDPNQQEQVDYYPFTSDQVCYIIAQEEIGLPNLDDDYFDEVANDVDGGFVAARDGRFVSLHESRMVFITERDGVDYCSLFAVMEYMPPSPFSSLGWLQQAFGPGSRLKGALSTTSRRSIRK